MFKCFFSVSDIICNTIEKLHIIVLLSIYLKNKLNLQTIIRQLILDLFSPNKYIHKMTLKSCKYLFLPFQDDVCIIGNSCYPSDNPACTASSGGSRDSNSSHDYLWLIGVAIGGIGIVILLALLIRLYVTNRYDNVFSYGFILVKSHIHSVRRPDWYTCGFNGHVNNVSL